MVRPLVFGIIPQKPAAARPPAQDHYACGAGPASNSTGRPLTSTPSPAGMRMYFRPSTTRASTCPLSSGFTVMVISPALIWNRLLSMRLAGSMAAPSPRRCPQ